MKLDLHIHTICSDGAWTPEAVVERANAAGLDVISISDHDTALGVEPAIEAARDLPLRILPAVELSSTTAEGREVHVLGYGVDPSSAVLQEHCDHAERLRAERLSAIVDRLVSQGISVSMEDVLEAAGPRRGVLGRPHLARAMVKKGIVTSTGAAFDRYIGDTHPAFVPTALTSPSEAVNVIRQAGGVPVWAHPPTDLFDSLLLRLIEAGLRGLEVYRPKNTASRSRRLVRVAEEHGLFTTGGSDWHDPVRNSPLGSFWVDDRQVRQFVETIGLG